MLRTNTTTADDNREEEKFQENSENGKIIDHGASHIYWTQLPNIVDDLDLDPYEFRLYMAYKRVAGEGGNCYMKTSSLLTKTKMGKTKFQECKKSLAKPRKELNGISLITIVERYHPTEKRRLSDDIIINNIWGSNFSKYSSPPERNSKKDLYPPTNNRTPADKQQDTRRVARIHKEEQQIKKNYKKRTTTRPIVHKSADGSSEPTSSPPLKKKRKEPDKAPNQDSLPLFHPYRIYLKGLSENEITQIRIFYEKNGKSVALNPIAWITACIKGNWYKEEMLSDEDLKQNFKFVSNIEKNMNKMGLNTASGTYLNVISKGIIFMRDSKEIPMPSFEMQNSRFQESIINILIKDHNYSEKILSH